MANDNPERESRAKKWGVKIASVAVLGILRTFLVLILLGLVFVFIIVLSAALEVGNVSGYAFVGFVAVLIAADVYGIILIRRKMRSIVRK